MGDLLGSPRQVAKNKVLSQWGKTDNIVFVVDGVLQVVSEPLVCHSGYGANLIEDDESLRGCL